MEEIKKWKVKCKNCKKEYEMEIGNISGLRKQYCLYCRCVGTLSLLGPANRIEIMESCNYFET